MTTEERFEFDKLIDKYKIDRYTHIYVDSDSEIFKVSELYKIMKEEGYEDIEVKRESGYYGESSIVAHGIVRKSYEALIKEVEEKQLEEKLRAEVQQTIERRQYEALKAKFEGEKK